MANDPITGEIIMYGGFSVSAPFANPTTRWNGITSQWIFVNPVNKPPDNIVGTMALYKNRIILLEGLIIGNFNLTSNTWQWDGTNWSQVPTAAIPLRILAAMGWDTISDRLILFGGSLANGINVNETWAWNGVTWTQLFPVNSPSSRLGAAMSIDPVTNQLILFGGALLVNNIRVASYNDTWTWNGNNWIQLNLTVSPSPRTTVMTYDYLRNEVILVGGSIGTFDSLSDTWRFAPILPIISASSLAKTICSGSNTDITLISDIVGTVFSWTVVVSSVSGAVNGSGNTISQVLTSNTGGTATYTVTGNANGCISTPLIVVITVSSLPVISASSLAKTICSGDNTNITLSSNVLNTTFSWTVVTGDVNGASDGTGNTISQILSSNTGGTATYTVTGNANGCISNDIIIVITVNPLPIISASSLAKTICSGDNTNITLSSNVLNTIFLWTVLSSNVNGASAGTGNTISQILTSNIGGTATYTVTGNASGCISNTLIIEITVNPLPIVTITPSQQTICSGEITNIVLTSNLVNTIFNWTVLSSNVIGASPGFGNTIFQTLTADMGGSVTYTVTPSVNGCIGIPQSIVVVVNPIPNVIVCRCADEIYSGEETDIKLKSNVPGTTFSWVIKRTDVKGGCSSSGKRICQTLRTCRGGHVKYIITPFANGCYGAPVTIYVYVNSIC